MASRFHPQTSRFVLIFLTSALIVGCVGGMKSQPGEADNSSQSSVSSQADSSQAPVDTALLPSIEAVSDTESPFFAEDQTTEALPSDVVAAGQLESLMLEGVGTGSNEILAKVSGDVTWQIEKTAPTEYVVRLPSVSVVAGGIAPVVAQGPELPIRSVRTAMDGEDTVIRVFADERVALKVDKEQSGYLRISPSTDASDLIADLSAPHPVDLKANLDEALDGAIAEEEVRAQLTSKGGSGRPDLDESLDKLVEAGPTYTGRLISLDLQDTDIDNALRIIAEVSNLNIIASEDVKGKITLRLIDVPWDQALDVILKTNGLDKVQEGNVVRIAPVEKLRAERESLKQAKQAAEELELLQVRFIRISYAKAADLKPLIDSVVSERGSATFDDRTNQLIVKDISRGIKNVVELVQKLDLRTPQILLETQIVEAQRTLLRDLGSEVGFSFIQSPSTGNPTGVNFPNSISLAGAIANAQPQNANPISLLFGSSDGTKNLSTRLTSLESEGRVNIVSRPSVATTNNKQAIIKSVQKVRVRLPNGGVSVATGQGASAAGSGQQATEVIEIGILLEVTPQASPDYFVLLDINAKSSTFGSESTEGIPNEVERSATSSVLVSSGQTFALGGIYKLSDRDNLNGVPFFKDIPVIGSLFRLQSVEQEDEELLFFITPRIVEGSFDDSTMKAVS